MLECSIKLKLLYLCNTRYIYEKLAVSRYAKNNSNVMKNEGKNTQGRGLKIKKKDSDRKKNFQRDKINK